MAASFVDDCICVGTDEALDDYRRFMAEGYTISDLSELTNFLSMQIHYNHEGTSIKSYQEKYIQKIAERFDIQPTDKLPKTPLPYDKSLEPTQERKLMRETHNDPTVRSSEHALPPSKVFEDNRSVIKWVENPCTHS